MSKSSSFCTAPDTCLQRSANIVWGVTRQARQALHEVCRSGPCHRPAPFGTADPTASRPRDVCESVGCVDLFMDVWIRAHGATHARFQALGPLPDSAFAYLTSSARSQLAELNRQGRVARGGVARPQRRDGTIGRIAISYEDPWAADVFRFLLGYAAAPGPGGAVWPLDTLVCRKNAWDGGDRVPGSRAARDELRADVESCLAVVRQVAGVRWLHDCILLPLANRATGPSVPVDDARPDRAGEEDDDGLDAAATVILQDLLARTAAGVGAGTALRAAVDAWLGDGPPPPAWAASRGDDIALRRLAKRLVSDLAQQKEAA
ncbi:hypothetical protein ACWGH3_28125 [Streptomyces sp. NPDC054884]|uniref:hypothetical protein n=1 Tax=Streptomyces sp. ME08-AFT2 TaxID=3028683 RepID=UPI0029AD84F0|nr:hypothetical protein [Streptomyces sp. ME08-AFT2]MDX3313356.1 hypothetical protein [Streptomyces sp. ME08-AFT2]